jgi:hypothetical protein
LGAAYVERGGQKKMQLEEEEQVASNLNLEAPI